MVDPNSCEIRFVKKCGRKEVDRIKNELTVGQDHVSVEENTTDSGIVLKVAISQLVAQKEEL